MDSVLSEMIGFIKDLVIDLLRVVPEVLTLPVVILLIAIVYKNTIIELLKSIINSVNSKQNYVNNVCSKDIEAESIYKQQKSISELSPQLHQSLAQALVLKGSYDEAIEQYRAAIILDPDNASAYIGLGNAFHKKGLFNDAIKSLERAVKIKPYWADARCNLGAAYSLSGIHDKAIDEFVQAINLNPNYAAAHYGLGIAYISAKLLDKADDQVEVLSELEPKFAEKLSSSLQEARSRNT
jgi:tetratricopeptide (TPR) repeat protein